MRRSLISFYQNTSNEKLAPFEIMIPAKVNLKRNINLNDTIKLFNTDFKVVGFTKSSLFNSFIISFESAQKLNIKPLSVDVILNEKISDNDFVNILDKLSKTLNVNNYELGNTLKLPIEETALISLGQLILVSAINVIFIFMNILYDRTKQYFIYRFSGMTRWQFYKLLLFEVLLDFIISFTLAIIIFTLANELLVKGVLGVMRYQFRYRFIPYVFVGYFAVYMVLIALGIRKYFNKSLMESYKR
ncbi:FtsX-like permease family protein [Helcococcus kunzii]|uniref:FtsX-like permease family protein n=1 Tax=Helcococcus kunzii TaxID=40091 RepID=UPI0021A783CF|nr:ABC transporter permease [Helcococcus kunzii]MCT1795412.1 ABC transporter permease [Helcococcus kunzii]